MGFNRWSPRNYGSNNTSGWRLSSYDANDQRLFESMRHPTRKEEWLDDIELIGQVWREAPTKYPSSVTANDRGQEEMSVVRSMVTNPQWR